MPYYAAADALVLPTYYDPCSLSVLEAAASGIPSATTRFNGAGELLTEGVDGFVLDDPADDRQLAQRLQELLEPAAPPDGRSGPAIGLAAHARPELRSDTGRIRRGSSRQAADAECRAETKLGRQLSCRPRVAVTRGGSTTAAPTTCTMRICLYTETAVPMLGGQALVVDALARQFVALGHDAVVLAPRQRSAGTADDAALPYAIVRHPRLVSTRWFVAWYGWWLRRLHRRNPFDVIHCHSTYPQGYIAAVCRATAGVPLVITSHGSDLDPVSLLYRKPQLRERYAAALKRADAVVAVSGATEANFRAVWPGVRRIARIPNGVDAAQLRCRRTASGAAAAGRRGRRVRAVHGPLAGA